MSQENNGRSSGEEIKVALVTGGSSGVGEATVKSLVLKGYQVAVLGKSRNMVERVIQECAELSPHKFKCTTLALTLDLTDSQNAELAVSKTIDCFNRLDVLVHTVCRFNKTTALDKSSYETYKQMMSVNIDATVKMSLAAIDHLKKSNGNMVFVSSIKSMQPSERLYGYCMSNAAISMFAKCLAIDLAPNVRVNIVSPGPLVLPIFERFRLSATDMAHTIMNETTILNHMGSSAEIASAILFLISSKASFINGHEMVVDGGYLLKPIKLPSKEPTAHLHQVGTVHQD